MNWRASVLFGVLVALIFSPVHVQARNASPLYEGAGFQHAMSEPRTSITIEARDQLPRAVRYWNRAAGWDVFTVASSPEVTFLSKAEAIADGFCNASGPYKCCPACAFWSEPPVTWCRIILPEYTDAGTVAHEMGHCLGFRHVGHGIMDNSRLKRTSMPRDRKLLEFAGYRGDDVE